VAWLIPLAGAVLTPVLPEVARHFAGARRLDVMIGLVATGPALTAALLCLPAGWVIDRVNHRRALMAGLAGFALFGAAPYWTDRLELMVALRLILGVTLTVVMTTGMAMIADYFDGLARRRWLAMLGATSNVVGVLVAVAGGLIGSHSWKAPFLLHLLALLLLLAVAVVLRPTRLAQASAPAAAAPASLTSASFDPRQLLSVCVLTLAARQETSRFPHHLARTRTLG